MQGGERFLTVLYMQVLDLCKEAKDVLKLPQELEDWAEASRLVPWGLGYRV